MELKSKIETVEDLLAICYTHALDMKITCRLFNDLMETNHNKDETIDYIRDLLFQETGKEFAGDVDYKHFLLNVFLHLKEEGKK